MNNPKPQKVGKDLLEVLPKLAIEKVFNEVENSCCSVEDLNGRLVCKLWNREINQRVKQLKLTRNKCEDLNAYDLNRYLSKLESLESLTIEFKYKSGDAVGFCITNLDLLTRLLKIFPNIALRKLNNLDLYFADSRVTKTDSDVPTILVDLLKASDGFTKLHLDLTNHKMGPNGLKAIVNALKGKVVKLIALDLNLTANDIKDDDDTVSALAELLMPCVSLRVLRLNMASNALGDKAATALAGLLTLRSGSLVDVKLDFNYRCKMSNDGAIILAGALERLISPGISLSIQLLGANDLSDSGMLALVRAVVKLGENSLVRLELHLPSERLSEVGSLEAIGLLASIKKLTPTSGSMGLKSLKQFIIMELKCSNAENPPTQVLNLPLLPAQE